MVFPNLVNGQLFRTTFLVFICCIVLLLSRIKNHTLFILFSTNVHRYIFKISKGDKEILFSLKQTPENGNINRRSSKV